MRTALIILVLLMSWTDALIAALDGRGTEAGKAFNQYQKWYDSLDRTDQHIDETIGDALRVLCYGNEEDKVAMMKQLWPDKFDEWFPNGKIPAGLAISSQPRQIWCDTRQNKDGEIMLPPHVVGHEPIHICDYGTKRLRTRIAT